jgi:hypothetical protein
MDNGGIEDHETVNFLQQAFLFSQTPVLWEGSRGLTGDPQEEVAV